MNPDSIFQHVNTGHAWSDGDTFRVYLSSPSGEGFEGELLSMIRYAFEYDYA